MMMDRAVSVVSQYRAAPWILVSSLLKAPLDGRRSSNTMPRSVMQPKIDSCCGYIIRVLVIDESFADACRGLRQEGGGGCRMLTLCKVHMVEVEATGTG